MKANTSGFTLGVQDVARAKAFYAALGWPIQQDYGQWVAFSLNDGALLLGLYSRAALAQDAGVTSEAIGSGGAVLQYLVRSEERVAEVLAEAERAGGKITKPAERAQWGGSSGHFTDPDDHLLEVAPVSAISRMPNSVQRS